MSENKVQFNLKNVHYSVVTESISGGSTTYSYATPVAVPGAVSLSLDPEGDVSKFYADGYVYFQSAANNGYSGELEIAKIPDAMLKDIWGLTEGSSSKVLTESTSAAAKSYALLFEIDGDADQEHYVLYNCASPRPSIASQTLEDTKEPQTASFTVNAAPRADGKVMARTTNATPTATKSGWYSSVFVEA